MLNRWNFLKTGFFEGIILGFSVQTGAGAISGDDGHQYQFVGAEWNSQGHPEAGTRVDFRSDGDAAVSVYRALSGTSAPSVNVSQYDTKNKLIAALLALFLGPLGIHKFYLGQKSPGFALLAATIIGVLLSLVAIGFVVLPVVYIVCFIEAIIYISKTDAEFQTVYVEEGKSWF